MNKPLLLIIVFFFISNCNLKPNIDHHGVHMLEIKNEKLIINEFNRNDVIKILGPPSVTSSFDNDILFYIERKITTDKIYKLGKRNIIKNNVLMIEIDNRGVLVKKTFFDLNEMNDLDISKRITEVDYQKTSFIYDFLSSMRQKINDPLGKRKRD
jgi:outer membrane protein assembly factor BamE (lipoprotein component of BamABCDE complex)|tara:strand:- start:334 stop:798 length:465 start_codon:yes stop_codon:yes gene_type:complete